MSGGADKGFSIDPTTVREWKRYPEYTDSGVAWFGEVPAGWELKRLKHISTVNDDALSENTPPDYQILYVDISDVDPVKGIQNAEEMTFEKAPSRARRLVRSGDVIVSTVRTYLRAITPIINPPENLIVSTGFAVIRTNSNFDSKFAGYTLRGSHFIEPVVAKSKGVSYPAINASELVCLEIPLPPLPEQQAIAAFLDRETARIDALIAKKQRFIELLEEKRQALITQAVTKGLDPDVEMKDSGVEWLGEVPVGWAVLPLSVRYHVQLGKMLDKKQITGGHLAPYLRNANIQWGKVDLSDLYEMDFNPSEREYYSLKRGDLLVCEGGEIGRTAVWNGELDECYYQKAVHRVRPRSQKDNSRYLYYLMFAAAHIGVFDAGADVSTIGHLTAVKLKKTRFAFPPYDEQSKIVEYLDSVHNDYENLIENTKRSLDLLHEYRTALISAAVTGKIDVRAEVKAT